MALAVVERLSTRLPRRKGHLTGPVVAKIWKPTHIEANEPAYFFVWTVNVGEEGYYTFRLIFTPPVRIEDKTYKMVQAVKKLKKRSSYVFAVGFIPLAAPMNIEFIVQKGEPVIAKTRSTTIHRLLTPIVKNVEELNRIVKLLEKIQPIVGEAEKYFKVDGEDMDMVMFALICRVLRGIKDEPQTVKYIEEKVTPSKIVEALKTISEIMEARGIEVRIGALQPIR